MKNSGIFPTVSALCALVGCGAVLSTLSGCSGSGSQIAANDFAPSRGKASISILWPERAEEPTRLVPVRADSIVVSLQWVSGPNGETVPNGPLPTNVILQRPAVGQPLVTTAQYSNLELGTYTATAQARPNSDGTGNTIASAVSSPFVVRDYFGNSPVTMTMASTAQTGTLTPSRINPVRIGQTTNLTLTLRDASANAILFLPSQITWTSSLPSVASVNTTGVVTALTVGSSVITARDTESGVTVTYTVTVVP